jgi:hypothetical protein
MTGHRPPPPLTAGVEVLTREIECASGRAEQRLLDDIALAFEHARVEAGARGGCGAGGMRSIGTEATKCSTKCSRFDPVAASPGFLISTTLCDLLSSHIEQPRPAVAQSVGRSKMRCSTHGLSKQTTTHRIRIRWAGARSPESKSLYWP